MNHSQIAMAGFDRSGSGDRGWDGSVSTARRGESSSGGGAVCFTPSVVAELAEVVAHAAVGEYRHLVLDCGALAAGARPGQFFQLLCPHPAGEQPFLRRPMSLYEADPATGRVAFLYKVTGAGTRGLDTLRVGDRLDIMGPLGNGFRLDPAWRGIVVTGRGAGLATLAPLAHAARLNGTRVTAILSARRPELLVSAELFRAHGATVLTVTDERGDSGPADVERILRRLVAEGACDALFTCGSSRLLRMQQGLAKECGLPGQVALEQQMACGLGLCHCCVRDFDIGGEIVTRRVCWDGPVFDLAEALP